jgi:hypothetical protein
LGAKKFPVNAEMKNVVLNVKINVMVLDVFPESPVAINVYAKKLTTRIGVDFLV